MATLAVSKPLVNRVSWGSLFAGFFFGFGVWAVLLALGAGIGLATFNPRDLGSWQGLGVGFGIWGVIAGIIAMFLAAWLTARLSDADARPAGMLHGAALWGFMVVVAMWIAAMAVAGTAGAAASAAGTAAQAAGQAAANPQLSQQAQQQAGAAQPRVQQEAQNLKQEAQQKAPEAAGTAKKAGAAGAWAFFIYGILTLGAAILGGRTGIPKERLLVGREERVGGGPPLTPSPQRA